MLLPSDQDAQIAFSDNIVWARQRQTLLKTMHSTVCRRSSALPQRAVLLVCTVGTSKVDIPYNRIKTGTTGLVPSCWPCQASTESTSRTSASPHWVCSGSNLIADAGGSRTTDRYHNSMIPLPFMNRCHSNPKSIISTRQITLYGISSALRASTGPRGQ